MGFLTLAWSFLKGVPLWVWLGLALLAGGLYYGHVRYESGQESVQIKWDAQKAKDKALADKLNADYRARERTEQLAAVEAWKKYDEAILAGKNQAAAITADLLSAKRQLRDYWGNGECDLPPDNAADRAGESNAELRAKAAGRIIETGTEADARITLLIERYQQAEKVCGTKE